MYPSHLSQLLGKGHPDGRALPTPRLNSTTSFTTHPCAATILQELPPPFLEALLPSTPTLGLTGEQESTASETQTSSLLPSLHFRCPICKMNDGA